ncbi:proteasome subunit alpha [Candidatus Pacearchaeota archaeon CG10_big_fil_rev_8_21_14_0_10_34_12]|nr:MAG: proteasome subunit alpha [Candidatus Pacearchaeota archaeon CG10_big_fil_rev_8_21_14_0_10_34_12]
MDLPTDLQHQAMGYDRTATMFSPEGHLLQVEYAEKTIRLGSTSIGMVCIDGVFILADRRVEDKLITEKSASKIFEIDSHIVASTAGIVSDARVLIERSQVLAQQHRVTYDSPVEPETIIKEVSNIKQQFTQYGGARPFAVSMMLAGMNGKMPQLFTSDVTGNYYSYYANAIGENDEKIREKLREKYSKDLTIKKGVKIALNIFREIQGAKFGINRFEIAYIKTEDSRKVKMDGEELKEFSK